MPSGPNEQISTSIQGRSLPFQATNVGDANTTANTVEPTSPSYVAAFDGCIIALTARHNAALSTGSQAWSPTINGTAKTALTATIDSSNQKAVAKVAADVIPFKAGDLLGVGSTKTGTVSPTTTDAAFLLEILYDGVVS